MTLWRVSATWANKGRLGESESIVLAATAHDALEKFWEVEDNFDLRTVSIEWLVPHDCVVGAAEIEPRED